MNINFSKPRPIIFLFIILIIVWPSLFYLHLMGFGEGYEWHAVVNSDAFQMGLIQGKFGEKSCVSLASLKNLDVVIIGSSHAFRSIDLYLLKTLYPNITIGLCAFPAWEVSMFKIFLKFLESRDFGLHRIIWIADAGSFVAIPEERSVRHKTFRSYLFDAFFQSRIRMYWAKSLILGQGPLGITTSEYHNNLKTQQKHFLELDPNIVEQIILLHNFPSKQRLIARVEESELLPDNKVNLQELCHWLEKKSIVLDVVIYPLPDLIQEAMPEKPDWAEIIKTGQYIQDNVSCVRFMVDEPIAAWGLDIRHFLNLSIDIDHQMWLDPAKFAEYYAHLPEEEKFKLFDPDHLNSLGAISFTKQLFEKLAP